MRVLVFLVGLLLSVGVYAAEISPDFSERLKSNKTHVFWEQVNNDDTTGNAFWNGGCGLMEVTGTQDDADFELQWGALTGSLSDADSREIPSGARFTSATGLGIVKFNFPAGFTSIKFNSAGTAAQDLDIRLIPISRCK